MRNKNEIGLYQWLGMLILFEALFFQLLCRESDMNFDALSILIAYIGGLLISKEMKNEK